MNLYNLHTNNEQLLGYEYIDDLAHASIKTEYDSGDTVFRNILGQIHNDNGPAYITAAGSEFWYKFGKKHREDGPAVIYTNDATEYWIDGEKVNNLTRRIQ